MHTARENQMDLVLINQLRFFFFLLLFSSSVLCSHLTWGKNMANRLINLLYSPSYKRQKIFKMLGWCGERDNKKEVILPYCCYQYSTCVKPWPKHRQMSVCFQLPTLLFAKTQNHQSGYVQLLWALPMLGAARTCKNSEKPSWTSVRH